MTAWRAYRDTRPRHGERVDVALAHAPGHLTATYDERGRWVLHPERQDERGISVPTSWLYALKADTWRPVA